MKTVSLEVRESGTHVVTAKEDNVRIRRRVQWIAMGRRGSGIRARETRLSEESKDTIYRKRGVLEGRREGAEGNEGKRERHTHRHC